jgi:hypothetical protein
MEKSLVFLRRALLAASVSVVIATLVIVVSLRFDLSACCAASRTLYLHIVVHSCV